MKTSLTRTFRKLSYNNNLTNSAFVYFCSFVPPIRQNILNTECEQAGTKPESHLNALSHDACSNRRAGDSINVLKEKSEQSHWE